MTTKVFTFGARAIDGLSNEVGARTTVTRKGTSTPVVVYSDSGLTTPATNPDIADAQGLCGPLYWNDAVEAEVTFTVKTSNNATTLLQVDYSGGVFSATYVQLGQLTLFEKTATGDGSDTTFTLTSAVASSPYQLDITIDGLLQNKASYSVSTDGTDTVVTFSEAPPDGAVIYFTSAVMQGVLGTMLATVDAKLVEIETVADNIDDVNTVAGISGDVTTVAGIAANVTTVAGISGDVTTVAGISANVTAVAAIDDDVSAVAAIDDDVSTVADNIADIQTVAAGGAAGAYEVTTTGGTSAVALKDKFVINVKDFGAVGNATEAALAWSGADDTAALNAAADYMRSLLGSNERSVTMIVPPGRYLVSSWNLTAIRGKGWSIYFMGAEIVGKTPGKACVDLLHSRDGTIYNMVVRGDETTPPRIGWQYGYSAIIAGAGVSSGALLFLNCHAYGSFTLAAEMNGGSEQTICIGGQARNRDTGSGSYCYIADSANWWGRRSDYLTSSTHNYVAKIVTGVTQDSPGVVTTSVAHGFENGDVVGFRDVGGMTQLNNNFYVVANKTSNTFELSATDTTGFGAFTTGGFVALRKAASFTLIDNFNRSYFKQLGGPAVWLGWHGQNWKFRNCWYYSLNDAAIDWFMDMTASGGSVLHGLEIDGLFEGTGLVACVRITRNGGGSPTIGGFKFSGSSSQATDEIILDTNESGTITFIGSDIDIPFWSVTPTAGLFSPTAKFTFVGNISSRNANGIDGPPNLMFGRYRVPDAYKTAYPTGAFDVEAPLLNGSAVSYAIHKGMHRFYGTNAAIADNTLTNESFIDVNGTQIGGHTLSMADDTAASITVPGANPSVIAVVTSSGGSGPQGLYWVRASGSPLFQGTPINSGTVNTTTGALAGTTGTDGKFTLSAHSDGKMYLENRLAATLAIRVIFLNAL